MSSLKSRIAKRMYEEKQMTIEYLMNKYKKYGIEYNCIKKIITLNKAIPVKEFCILKCDILKCQAKINKIRVEAN